MSAPVKLMIVDDEPHLRSSLTFWFREEGYDVLSAGGGREALATLVREAPQILLVDIKMPGMDGLEVLRKVRETSPETTVIIMTAYASVETAIQALKDGAYDYIVKPFDPEAISRLVKKAAERYTLLSENRELKARIEAAEPALDHGRGRPDGPRPRARRAGRPDRHERPRHGRERHRQGARRAPHPQPRAPGASGRSASSTAAPSRRASSRASSSGTRRGPSPGPSRRRRGKVELAHEGTLFLDEIGDVPPKVQVDLLRVLQEKQVTRVGGNQPVPVDFRLVTATHRDLEDEVAAGRFRQDFFFRIHVFDDRAAPRSATGRPTSPSSRSTSSAASPPR